ncbi:MAG TPA: hypothetical protein VL991_14925 [Terracidiphilus sp.]|nr:hypothetical protein [Terracidiphilus sp.]
MKTLAHAEAQGKRTRLAVFANFFKSYMSVSTIVAASIPIPIGTWGLIPIYSQQRGYLTVYASLLCFLLMAVIFSIRHRLSVVMFGSSFASGILAVMPFVFIALTLACISCYHATLLNSLEEFRQRGVMQPTNIVLSSADLSDIPYALELSIYYLGIFVFAEAAFLFTAIREYLQDALHLDETALLHGTHGVERGATSQEIIEKGAS